MTKYLTTAEIATMTNKDHSMIRRAIANGWLKATKKGHTNLVSEADFKKWEKIDFKVYPKLVVDK